MVSSVLDEMLGADIMLLWIFFTIVAKSLFGAKIPVITDETYLLQAELFAFRRPSYKNRTSERLFSPNKEITQEHQRVFLSFWIATLHATTEIVPMVCGTALRLCNIELIKATAGNTDMQPHIFISFPTLNEDNVTVVLHHFLNLSGIPEGLVRRIARKLIGKYIFCFPSNPSPIT
jgi:hypothetical protein